MTGRERLLRTIRGEATDRVPISPFLYFNAIYEMFGYEPHITGGYFDYFYPRDFDAIGKYVEYCDTSASTCCICWGRPWRVYDISHPGRIGTRCWSSRATMTSGAERSPSRRPAAGSGRPRT